MSEKKRVLVVDDDDSLRAQLGMIVEYFGYEPVLAANGAEALRLFREKPADLVLADVYMPEMNGPELLHELHQIRPQLPVIILTGFPSEDSIRQTLLEGGFTYLTKPVDLNQLRQILERALAGKG